MITKSLDYLFLFNLVGRGLILIFASLRNCLNLLFFMDFLNLSNWLLEQLISLVLHKTLFHSLLLLSLLLFFWRNWLKMLSLKINHLLIAIYFHSKNYCQAYMDFLFCFYLPKTLYFFYFYLFKKDSIVDRINCHLFLLDTRRKDLFDFFFPSKFIILK